MHTLVAMSLVLTPGEMDAPVEMDAPAVEMAAPAVEIEMDLPVPAVVVQQNQPIVYPTVVYQPTYYQPVYRTVCVGGVCRTIRER
jgi:hypothetical protein